MTVDNQGTHYVVLWDAIFFIYLAVLFVAVEEPRISPTVTRECVLFSKLNKRKHFPAIQDNCGEQNKEM